MKIIKSKFFLIALLALVVLSLAACGQKTEAPATGGDEGGEQEAVENAPDKKQEPIVVLAGANQTTLDPYSSGSIVEQNVLLHVIDTLVAFNENADIIPCLATEWSNVEPKVWEFKLRDDVYFHDGSKLTAEDVKVNIERIVEKEEDGTLIGNYGWIQASVNFDYVEIVDDYTVRVHTKEPVPALLVYIAEVFIMPKDFFDGKTEEELQTTITGSGPYKFVEWKKDQYVAIERNDDYWGGKPDIEKILFKYAPEGSTRVAELLTGGAHVIDKVPTDMLDQLKDGCGPLIVPSGTRQYVGFVYYGHPVIGIKEVRQAINYAVDVDGIIDNLLGGSVERVATFVNEPWANPDTTAFPHDVEKAKGLLAEAGLKDADGDGFLEYNGEPIKLVIQTPKGRYIKDVEISQAIAADLAKIGLDVEVRIVDWSVFVGQLDAKTLEGDMFFIGSGSAFEGQSDISDVYPTNSSNYGQWKNEEFKNLYDELAQTFDEAKRRELLYEMQDLMKEEAAMLFMYFQPSFYGVSDKLNWSPRKDARIVLTDAVLK